MLNEIWSLQLCNTIVEFQKTGPVAVLVQKEQKFRTLSLRVEHKLRKMPQSPESQSSESQSPKFENSEPLVQCYTKEGQGEQQNPFVCRVAFVRVQAQTEMQAKAEMQAEAQAKINTKTPEDFCSSVDWALFGEQTRFLWLPEQILDVEKMQQLERSARFLIHFEGQFSILYDAALTAESLQSLQALQPKFSQNPDNTHTLGCDSEMGHLQEAWQHLSKNFFQLRSVLGPRSLSYFLKGWYSSELTGKGLHWHPHFASLRLWDFSDLLEINLWLYEHYSSGNSRFNLPKRPCW